MASDTSNLKAFVSGAWDSLPVIVASVPFGVLYGALAVAGGLSEAMTLAMSLLVFAGSAQFIAVTLIVAAVAAPVIVFTVFIVNLRHLLYSATLMTQMQKYPQWVRVPLAFWLTDETFAVINNKLNQSPGERFFAWYYFGSGLAMYCNWQLCTWIGFNMGKGIPDLSSWGLEVAMVVAFVGIVIGSLHRPSHWLCATVAIVCAVLTRDWPHQSGLLASGVLAILAALLVDWSMGEEGENV